MRTFTIQMDAMDAINAGELEIDQRFLIGDDRYRMVDTFWYSADTCTHAFHAPDVDRIVCDECGIVIGSL